MASKLSLGTRNLSKDVKEVKEPAILLMFRRTLQADKMARVKALKWEKAWYVPRIASRLVWSE